jgi:hypothetical protein
MAISRIRIDYDVYPPNHESGQPCWTLRNLRRAMSLAKALGPGARVYRNFNQTNKRGEILGDWWSDKRFWTWTGLTFNRQLDANRFDGSDEKR